MNEGTAGVLAATITGFLTLAGIIYTVYNGPVAANRQKAIEEKRAAENANLEEAKRLREEAWQRKEEIEEELRAVRAQLAKWERAFWSLYNSASKMLAKCGSSVGTALSFLDGAQAEPAKKELSKLDVELKDYHLPDAPKAE